MHGVQVKQNTDMESHEEKLHKMIIQSKINDTKDVMKRKAIEIDKQKLDREARARESKVPYVPSVSSISAGGRSPMHNDDNTPTYSKCASICPRPASSEMLYWWWGQCLGSCG